MHHLYWVILDHGTAWPEHSTALCTHGQKSVLMLDHAEKVTSKWASYTTGLLLHLLQQSQGSALLGR